MSDSPNISKFSHKSGINNSGMEIIKSFMGREPNYSESMVISKLWHEKPEIAYSRKKLTDFIDYKNPVLNETYNNWTSGILKVFIG